jgi:hypothetical protein
MAITWNVVALDAQKTIGSLSDVVTVVHWTAQDSETVGSGDSAEVHNGFLCGCVGLAEANSSSFTAYKDITKDNAIAWAKAALGSNEVTRIETSIAGQISESKTPTKTSGVPW